jgi:hypothetical protein
MFDAFALQLTWFSLALAEIVAGSKTPAIRFQSSPSNLMTLAFFGLDSLGQNGKRTSVEQARSMGR